MNRMNRQTLKIIISLIAIMAISTGFKALQINLDQKVQLEDYGSVIEAQNEQLKALESAQEKIAEKDAQIEALEASVGELRQDILDLTAQYEVLKHQNEALTDKVVYLTFDDGPSNEVTEQILEILKQYSVKATFFVQGRNVDKYPEMLKKIHEAGHVIGNHSYSHNYTYIYASEDQFWKDFNRCQEAVFKVTGENPTIFRFPGGSASAGNTNGEGFILSLGKSLIEQGYQYFDWNIDTGDAAGGYAASGVIKANAIAQIAKKKNAIVLMHDTDAKKSTVEALPEIIEHYLSMGYRFDVLTTNGYTSQFR